MDGDWLVLSVGAFVTWYALGVGGFVYWWTSEWDLDTDDLAAGLFIGLLVGPLAWIVGRAIHGGQKDHRRLMRRRGGEL